MPTGVTGATWSVSYAMFGCRSELFFGHPDAAVNLARWQMLNDRKDEITAAFGDAPKRVFGTRYPSSVGVPNVTTLTAGTADAQGSVAPEEPTAAPKANEAAST